MKTKNIILSIGILFVGLLLGRYWIPAAEETAQGHQAEAAEEATVWTCSMHPQIRQPEPGDCPICGMDLIPLLEDSTADAGPRSFSMSESARALADIRTTVVKRDYPEAEIRLVGKLAYDETKVKSLTARFPARIDTLYVNYTGIPVARGEHLARVYSPDLLSAQQELIASHQRDPDGVLAAVAREKLRLWDLLPEQIEEIVEGGTAKDSFELRAPIDGVVVDKYVKEGDYVKTGEPLFRIVDLSELWLYLDAYESDLAWLRFGQEVSFTVEAYPGETFSGPITFIEPELDMKTRTVAVRVNVPNADGRLKPGMFARGTVHSRIAEDGNVYAPDFAGKWISPMHPEIIKDGPGTCDVCGMDLVPAETLGYVSGVGREAPVVVPASAVLRTGKRAVVYVQRDAGSGSQDDGRSLYEGREIVLGPRAGDQFIVVSGLEPGEVVVTNGAFKIDSALQIQAKPSMMSPSDPEMETGAADEGRAMIPELPTDLAVRLMQPYLDLQAALAGDDLDGAREALSRMMEVSGHAGELAALVHEMLAADTLEAIRRPHFEDLSNALIPAVESDPEAFGRKLYRMHCPMAYPDRGADWIQDSANLRNPYFGAMMLTCGEVKGTWDAGRGDL